ncbi:MAG: branched-chain amino acid ABC transporter permease [Candidatus Bathyarchaeia archaeon]
MKKNTVSFENIKLSKDIRFYLIIGGIIVALLVPLGLGPDWITLFFLFFTYTAMAEVYNLLSGYSGMLALGFHGFVGFGGYITAIACTLWGLHLLVSMFISGTMCVLLALATSFLIIKMRGLYFAMGTLVSASVLFYWFQGWSYVGGGYGMPIVAHVTVYDLYYISLVIAIASIFVAYIIVQSRVGLRLKAIADDDIAAESYGVDVFKTKLLCWVISSFFAGISGSLYFIYSGFISPAAAFAFYWTLSSITATVFGGVRTILGPIIGAFFVVWLRQTFLVEFPGLAMLVYGVIIVAMVLVFPRGIMGYVHAFLTRRKMRGP